MDFNSENTNKFHHSPPQDASPYTSPATTIGIYTVLSVLMVMKSQLGLEAMLEYTSRYLRILEKHNPDVKDAVVKALKIVDVEVIYKDAMRRKDGA